MRSPCRLRDLSVRLTTGAYVFHSGMEKWNGNEETAAGVHGFAAAAFPLSLLGDD